MSPALIHFLRVGLGPGNGRSVGLPRLLTYPNLNGVSGSQVDLIFASVGLEPTAVYKSTEISLRGIFASVSLEPTAVYG